MLRKDDGYSNKYMYLLKKTSLLLTRQLRARAKIKSHFRRSDLGWICSLRGGKTTGIASSFEDFATPGAGEDDLKPGWIKCDFIFARALNTFTDDDFYLRLR
jgi:hypothetical protein